MLCFPVRRKENVPTDAFLALSENATLKLTLFMKYRFRNPNQNVVWFKCNSLIKKTYCKVGWDAVLCLFRLVPDVSDARIDATLINFVMQMGRCVTYIHFGSHTIVCMRVSYTRTRTHAHTSL